MPHDDDYLSVPALKARGWTDTLITRYLDPPDRTCPNPVFPSQAPMRLYASARVHAVEQSPEWSTLHARAQRQRTAGTKAAQTKRDALLAWVATLRITVPSLEQAQLCAAACQHYNRRKADREWEDWTPATPESAVPFLQRITVNYLRHRLTHYEHLLEATFGRVGVDEARQQIRQRVYEAIAEAYPDLASECTRQYAQRHPDETAQTWEPGF